MASTSDFRNGFVFEEKGHMFKIVEFLHVKPGKGPAFVRTKLKKILTGQVLDRTFRSGEKVKEVRLIARKMQYLYQSGDESYFMDNETFEQIALPQNLISEVIKYVKENDIVKVVFRDENPIDVEIPAHATLEIVETDPGVKGDTATGGTKPAKLETGIVVNVPLFVKQGEIIRIDTRTGEYLDRAKK